MNRLTKEIGLVLITSSLMLPGCYGHPQPQRYEFAKEKDRLRAEKEDPGEDVGGGGDFGDTNSPDTSATPGSTPSQPSTHRGGHIPIFIPLGGGSRGTSSGPATSSGFRPGPATSSGSRSTAMSSGGTSSVGSSARGGFGATGHGVSS
ncbi:MAG: hypothetical protein NTY19_45050 [Planctomycetota bacterium]|nr:hypothetical protein [Planctomycetota bacterium]